MGEAISAIFEANEEARAHRLNRRMALLQAEDTVRRGDREAGRLQMATTQEIGTMRAAGGASGVDLSSGSALEALADARMIGEVDAGTIRANAMREAWGYRISAAESNRAANAAWTRAGVKVGTSLLAKADKFASFALGGAFSGGG